MDGGGNNGSAYNTNLPVPLPTLYRLFLSRPLVWEHSMAFILVQPSILLLSWGTNLKASLPMLEAALSSTDGALRRRFRLTIFLLQDLSFVRPVA